MVVMVRTVVIPRATRAGADSGLIQNENQEMMTVSTDGIYVSMMKYPRRRLNRSLILSVENFPVKKRQTQHSSI